MNDGTIGSEQPGDQAANEGIEIEVVLDKGMEEGGSTDLMSVMKRYAVWAAPPAIAAAAAFLALRVRARRQQASQVPEKRRLFLRFVPQPPPEPGRRDAARQAFGQAWERVGTATTVLRTRTGRAPQPQEVPIPTRWQVLAARAGKMRPAKNAD